MNRRIFLLGSSVCFMSTPVLAKKKKKKGKGKGKGGGNPDKLIKEAKGSMTGTLKEKKHEADRDEYIFSSGSKTYTVSRNIYDEIKGNLDRSVTIECKVINENRIIAIKSMK